MKAVEPFTNDVKTRFALLFFTAFGLPGASLVRGRKAAERLVRARADGNAGTGLRAAARHALVAGFTLRHHVLFPGIHAAGIGFVTLDLRTFVLVKRIARRTTYVDQRVLLGLGIANAVSPERVPTLAAGVLVPGGNGIRITFLRGILLERRIAALHLLNLPGDQHRSQFGTRGLGSGVKPEKGLPRRMLGINALGLEVHGP